MAYLSLMSLERSPSRRDFHIVKDDRAGPRPDCEPLRVSVEVDACKLLHEVFQCQCAGVQAAFAHADVVRIEHTQDGLTKKRQEGDGARQQSVTEKVEETDTIYPSKTENKAQNKMEESDS